MDSFIVAAVETSLLGIEAGSVIALRMQVIMQGGRVAREEAELMFSEKALAARAAYSRLAPGSSPAEVHADLRSVIRRNFDRLSEG